MTAPTRRRRKAPYRLTAPCANCPFRSDVEPYLRPDRAREIARGLRESGDFLCHKTTIHVEGEEGGAEELAGPGSQQCAGSLIIQARMYPGQVTRVAAALGMVDLDALAASSALVYADLDAFVDACARAAGECPETVTTDDGEVLEYEHCGVVGPDCVDPPGFGGGGAVWGNDAPPTCNPLTDTCVACANSVCAECWGEASEDGPLCVYCAGEGGDATEEEEELP